MNGDPLVQRICRPVCGRFLWQLGPLVVEEAVAHDAQWEPHEADAVGASSADLCGGALGGCEADPHVKDPAPDVGAESGARALVASECVILGLVDVAARILALGRRPAMPQNLYWECYE